MSLFNLQGKILLSAVAINNTLRAAPMKQYYVGSVPEASIQLETQTFPHFEAESGDRLQDFELQGGKTGTITSSLENLSEENMALVLHAAVQAQSTTPVTGMALPDSLAEGDVVKLPDVKPTSVSIEDSEGTPNTLPSGQYTVDADFGTITLDDITTGGPYTQPFKVSYTPGAASSVPIFTDDAPERMLWFQGKNTVTGEKLLIELYRVLIPVSMLDALKHAEGAYGNIPFNPKILADTTRPTDDVLGQFGRIIDLT